MKKQNGEIYLVVVGTVMCFALLIFIIIATALKQDEDHKRFMGECLQDKKQYECDVLWSQTDASKQNRDLAIGLAVGAAIGAAAGRR